MRRLDSNPWRLSGIAGVLFVVFSFAAAALPGQSPAYNQDRAALLAWFAQNGDRFLLGHCLAGLAFLLLYVPFFAGLCERLRLAEGEPAIWSRVTWGGALLCPAAGTASGVFVAGLAHLAGSTSAEVAAFAAAANFHGLVVSGALSGVALAGAAVVILRTRVFSRWLGGSAAVLAPIAIGSTGAVAESDPAGAFATVNSLAFAGYFAWMLAASIAMIRARHEPAHEPLAAPDPRGPADMREPHPVP